MAAKEKPVDQDWECEDDLRTLIRAKEIQADPKRFKRAQELADIKMKAAARIASEQPSKPVK